MKRTFVLLLLSALLSGGSALGGPPTRPPKPEGQPRWRLLWQRPIGAVRSLSLSDDGRGIAVLDFAHTIRRLDPITGRSIWSASGVSYVSEIAAASGGQVLAWKAFSPSQPDVWILNAATGSVGARRQRVSGAVWSVGIRPDGMGFFVGAGDRTVSSFSLGQSQLPPFRKGVPGLPESLAIANSPSIAACGLWLASGVAGLSGTAQWRFEEPESSRWFDLQISADGSTLFALSQKGSRQSDRSSEARIDVWDAPTGKHLWAAPIPGRSVVARTNASGSRIVVSYATMAHYSTGDVMEAKLAIFDRAGTALIPPRGGAYLSPRLVALSASGNRITVLDGSRSLCTLDGKGRTVARFPLVQKGETITIRESLSTADGSGLLLYRGDGILQYYQATAE